MSHNVSRRSFFRLATDSLIALPAVANGFLALTPQEALAADTPAHTSEDDGGNHEGAKAEVIVVNPWEVGFMIVDMADGGQSRVPHAHVEIQSRYNRDEWAKGDADDKGVVVLDVSRLAENDAKKDPKTLDKYEFNASITITCPGYRDFRITLTRIKAGGGFLIPGRSITDTKPYPELVSFDEWDVLYTIESYQSYEHRDENNKPTTVTPDFLTFNASPKNTDKHTLVVSLKNLAQATTICLIERKSGKEVLSQKVQPTNGTGTATFSGTFLQDGSSAALPLDTDFDVTFDQGTTSYRFPIQLRTKKTVFDAPKTTKDLTAKPLLNVKNGMGGGSSLAMTFPSSSPIAKSEVFTMWLPEFPINVYIDPSGYYQLTAKTPSWGYKNDYGKEDEAGWKSFSRKSVSDQISEKRKSWRTMLDKTGSAYSADHGKVRQISYSRTFSFTGWLQFVAVAQWDSKQKMFQGDAAGQAVLALGLSIVEAFLAGPIPVFIQFDLKGTAALSLGPGFTLKPKSGEKDYSALVTQFNRYEWDYTNTGLTFTVVIAPSLSVGVGIAGVASISLRGTFTVTVYVGVTPKTSSDKPLPHVTAGYNFKADIVAQFFLWTYAWVVFDDGNANWYNNWNSSLKGQAQETELDPLATHTYDEVMQNIRPVTDDMLLKAKEFEGSTPITGQSDEPEIYLDVEYNDEFVMDDGTTLTRAVYTLKVRGKDEDAAAGEGASTNSQAAPDTQATPDTIVSDESASEDGATVAPTAAMLTGQAGLRTQAKRATPGSGLVMQAEDEIVSDTELPEVPVVTDTTDEAPVAEGGEPTTETPAENSAEAAAPASIDEQYEADPFAYRIPGDFVSTREEGDLVAMADTAPGVAGIGDDGGIRPTADTQLASNVFGDPRLKVIEVDGTVYCMRIASATVDGKPVTRLTATVLSGYRAADIGKKQVLDFKINPSIEGISRADLCDYEFDVVAAPYDAGGGMVEVINTRMHAAIISGVRNTSNFATASTNLILSYVQFHHNKETGFDWVITSMSMRGAQVFSDSPEYPYHSISNLSISVYRPALASHLATITYLDRMASTPEDVMRRNDVKVRLGVAFVPHTNSGNTNAHLVVPDPAVIEQKMGAITDLSIYELECWPEVEGIFTFMLRGAETAYYYVMRRNDSTDNPGINFIKQVGTTKPSVRLHAWKTVSAGGGYNPISVQRFLCCGEDNKLCYAQVAEPWNADNAKLNFWDQGPDNFGISSFGVWGDFVYWPESRSGVPGHKADPDTGELTELPDISECHLMAARLRESSHSDPFILADFSYVSDEQPGHMLDDIVSVGGNTTALSVVASELTDRDMDLASVWYLQIPFVKTVTALRATAVTPFVAPGKPAGFYLAVRNDGNTFLSGCDVALYDQADMYDASGALKPPASTGTVTFSSTTIQESPWNPLDDQGKISGIEPDGALPPGKTAVYLAEVTIPESWASGRHEVVLITRNGMLADELTGQADGDVEVVEYSLDPGEVTMDVLVVEEPYWKEAYLSDAPIYVSAVDDNPPSNTRDQDDNANNDSSNTEGSGTPGGTGSGKNGNAGRGTPNTGSGSKTKLADTGDEPFSPVLGIAGAGLTALGIAAAAYERRRAENEAEE